MLYPLSYEGYEGSRADQASAPSRMGIGAGRRGMLGEWHLT
jgi:hypothetical protein